MMLVIYGPTATGKTALALKIAKRYNGEIVSADSRQVYRRLDIGTGKVSPTSKVEKYKSYWIVDGVKIRGYDLIEPGERFSAFDFLNFAINSIIRINKQSKLPIIAGGTGFYIKALLEGLDTYGIQPNWKLRAKLEKLTTVELFQLLKKNNPKKADQMNISDRQNPRRLVRALEISLATSLTRQPKIMLKNEYLLIGLTAPNTYLYGKADKWLAARLKLGLTGEVETQINSGVNPLWLEKLGLEYRWITRYVLHQIEKSVAQERLKGNIHAYIRRQKTYFKQFPTIELIDISQKGTTTLLEKRIKLWYTQSENGSKQDIQS